MKNDFLILSFLLHLLGGVNPGLEVKTQSQGTEEEQCSVKRRSAFGRLEAIQFCGFFLRKKKNTKLKTKVTLLNDNTKHNNLQF